MEKKQWSKPALEVLDVQMTELQPQLLDGLDKDYPERTPFPELTWS